MIRSDQILDTVEMIQKENLDVRTVTMGIDLRDCRTGDAESTCAAVEAKIRASAKDLVRNCDEIGSRYAVPVVNKRIAVTPAAEIGAGMDVAGFVRLAAALDRAAEGVGVDILGGFSADVCSGVSPAARTLIDALPRAMAGTGRVCASFNAADSRHGINMDALNLLAERILGVAAATAERDGFGAAKCVVFANQPGDNPFMAGAIHGAGQPEKVLHVGVSGPGVVARALERRLGETGGARPRLDDLAEEIKQAAFRVTRCGELIGREVAAALDVPFGVVDLSLAPTPAVGDSVGDILRILGVDAIGAPGTTALLAMLTDAVKKGGAFASHAVGGLSGAFVPVMEDAELAAAAEAGHLSLEKLEAMTSVCSVGLDMVPVPGDTDAATIAALTADELAIGVVNHKTTGVRIIPVPGREAGERVSFGGLFGASAIMTIREPRRSGRMAAFGGRIPAPIHSLRN
ncbi:PFL family protein [Kiritimatiella glycovorans]|uniref:Uncharacterized protein n=1 Tax=Kiritimatiella glycovorans TaxID=1307763 RepID=A0A0G3EFF1_9BACT|nr:PFL family protein [Kiritimatiella glycovorans]AKJ65181.1 hypothetical protein L21SP4_01946 [Kiritimatiella glycovorans]